jgi:competence protein ComEC
VLIASARSLGVPVITIDSSTPPRAIGKVDIRFLNPAPRVSDNPGDVNDRSLVFRIDHGRFSLLMTGDIGRDGLARIRADGNDLSAQVLKVPHHGSSASTAVPVLRTIGPRVAIISCGYDNPFGFPGKKSLAALREVGADVFRTDLDGAVTVTTNGEYIEVESMGGRRLYRDIPDDKRQ